MSGAAGKRTSSKARSGLMSSTEEQLNKEVLLDLDALPKMGTDAQLKMIAEATVTVNSRFSTIHEIVNEASDGLDPRTTDNKEKIQCLWDENKQLRFELDILKGVFIKMEAENTCIRDKVTVLTAQSMKDNLTFGGLIADESTESTIDTLHELLTEKMSLDVDSEGP